MFLRRVPFPAVAILAITPMLVCNNAHAETLADRIRTIENGIQGEPQLLAVDSRLQLASLLIQRSPKDAARIIQDAVSIASGFDSPWTRTSLLVRAGLLMAKMDLPRALQVIDGLPLAVDSDADLFPRDRGYAALLNSGDLPDSVNRIELTRQALQAGACPISAINERVMEIRNSMPSDATLLSLQLAACIRGHKMNPQFVNDALQFIRPNPSLPQDVLASVLEALLVQVESPAFTERSIESMTGVFPDGQGKKIEVRDTREMLRLQIALVAKARVPTVYASLASRPEYASTRERLETSPGVQRPISVTQTMKVEKVPEIEGLAAARAESKALPARERLPFARRQQSVEVRVALLFDVLHAGPLPEADQNRLIAELTGDLSKTRPSLTRALRAQSLVVKSAALENSSLIVSSAVALARSASAYCRCEQENCTTFEKREDCLGLYESASKVLEPIPAAREAAAKEDSSLRTRFALIDLPRWKAEGR